MCLRSLTRAFLISACLKKRSREVRMLRIKNGLPVLVTKAFLLLVLALTFKYSAKVLRRLYLMVLGAGNGIQRL